MKFFAALLFASALSLCAASGIDVGTIVKKFEKVGAWRLPPTPDYEVYDPFKRAEPLMKKSGPRVPPKVRRTTIRVTAVMNDKAFVNGRWVGKGSRVGSYRIIDVRADGIVVKEGNKRLLLPLKRERKLLQIKDKQP
ncbi:hypothetical protein [Hydrogenimonas urashimensis]|uniref:hypothetical protein n=1 Tax=Hydrogenimonas urashimensis TaxID=2740515 RepID=UPI001915849F|nr:hypothetical protein [Hydrogenimonas urashimensis]